MMRNYFLILALIVQTGIAEAQKGLWLSVNYLPQITSMRNKDDASLYGQLYQYRTTYDQAIGIQMLYNFSDHTGIGSGLLFSSEGQSFLSVYNSKEFPGKKRMDYLKVPVVISLNTNPDKKLIFKLNGGIQLNYLLKADGPLVIISKSSGLFDLQQANNSYFHKVLFAGTAGAGIDFRISEKIRLGFTARTDYAFTDAEKKSATYQYPGGTPFEVYKLQNPDRPKTHNFVISQVWSVSYKLK
ncbi:MAG: porin family protein [Cytophagaceae bacterium]